MSLLEFRDVSKRYPDGTREIRVLDDVSFRLDEGEAVGLLAARRMGKTTLLHIAAGLELPDKLAPYIAQAGPGCGLARRSGAVAAASAASGAA